MAGSINSLFIRDKDGERTEYYEELNAPGVTSEAIRLQGTVTVQVSGTATDVVAIVERSSRAPGSGQENWAPAEDDPFENDLSAGIAPREYIEPAIGWWRVRVATLTGGNIRISILGETG